MAKSCWISKFAGAVAPKSTLAVYFRPNTDQGFYNAIAAAFMTPATTPR